MSTRKRGYHWYYTVRATPRAVARVADAIRQLAYLPANSRPALRVRNVAERHLRMYLDRLIRDPDRLYLLQWEQGGIPEEPEVFRTAAEAGARMVEYARASERRPMDRDYMGDPVEDWDAVARGDVALVQDEAGDNTLRLFIITIPR